MYFSSLDVVKASATLKMTRVDFTSQSFDSIKHDKLLEVACSLFSEGIISFFLESLS